MSRGCSQPRSLREREFRAAFVGPNLLLRSSQLPVSRPDSVLVTAAFREYAGTYLIVGDSRKSIEYIDKFLAQLAKIDPGMLPEGLDRVDTSVRVQLSPAPQSDKFRRDVTAGGEECAMAAAATLAH
jgi:hypothetical protein